MKTILGLNSEEAKKYFFKNSSYINFDIPIYFDFSELFLKLIAEIGNKNLNSLKNGIKARDCDCIKARDCEGVNYIFLNNKGGKYEWRPFEIIHPFLYVELVYLLTKEDNWNFLINKFDEFKNNGFINCLSLPVISETLNSNKAEQVLSWWENIEQESIILGLDYDYLFHTDITDCYSSIYTHSIAWALHGKEKMKKIKNRRNEDFLGNKIDNLLQDMSYGQTNGIPQGSNIMDFLAEIVLGYTDLLIKEKFEKEGFNIDNFKILRYRDDYRIFVNNSILGEKILKIISEVLSGLGLKLSRGKTKYSNDIIKSSLKEDKYEWIINGNSYKSLDKQLIIIKDFSEKHNNSGALLKILQEFNNKLSETKIKNTNVDFKVLISIIVNIMLHNPRTFPIFTAILSKILKVNDNGIELIGKILTKFEKIPNTGHLEIWLQRITLKLDSDYNNYNSEICKKVSNNNIELWNSKWISNKKIKKILKETKIVLEEKINELDLILSNEEVALFSSYEYLFI